MTLTQRIMTQNETYKKGVPLKPSGIVVHSTATPQPSADAYINQWDKAGVNTAVHAFVEAGRVVQTLPWTIQGAHCGGSANKTHIGFEICEPSGHTYVKNVLTSYDAQKNTAYFKAVWDNAVELCATLCRMYSIPTTAIICHSEGYKQGVASNHADVMHWFPLHGKNMDDFRAAVFAMLNVGKDNTPDAYAKAAVGKAVANGILLGDASGDLMLHKPITRQDYIVILDRLGLLDKGDK